MTRTLFAGGLVFDGSGADAAVADIAVEDGRIVEVGRGLDGDQRIDLTGKGVLPGLFDCHTHVTVSSIDMLHNLQTPFSYRFYEAAHNLAATLRIGITTVRDAGGADLGIKQAVADGLIAGPRMQISLGMISQTGGHGDGWMASGQEVKGLLPVHPGVPDTRVDGPDEMRRMVRTLVRMGADVIKIATSGGVLSPRDKPTHAHFRPTELEVLVEEATAAGIWAWRTPRRRRASRMRSVPAFARSSTGSTSTMRRSASCSNARRGWCQRSSRRAGCWIAAAAGASIPEASMQKAREVVEIHRDAFRRAAAAGVGIAMGTDSGVTPHGQNLRELALMVEGGLSPAQAVVATTRSAAELMGLDAELGTLQPGKRADLVVVDGDPLDVATLAGRVEAVYMDGRQVAGSMPA